MKKTLFTVSLMAGMFSTVAQVKCPINKAYAYFTVSFPGTQMVDENGIPVPPVPQVTRFIYLDCKGISKPVVVSVSYNNIVFKPSIEKTGGNIITVGKNLDTQKEIVIRTKKGNTFWKLALQPADDKPQDLAACKNIIVKLKTAGKICTYKLPIHESQLFTMPMY